MDKDKSSQTIQHVQSTNEKLNVVCSRPSSGSSSPNGKELPLFSVHHSPNDTTTLMIDSQGQVICSKCNCTLDYCNCDPPPNRQKACSLTLESENTFISYANNQLKNTFPYHEAKRSLSVSVPSRRKQQQAAADANSSKYGEHLNLINVNICSESPTVPPNPPGNLKIAGLPAPSIHISENPLSNSGCTCPLNHTKSLKAADKHQYLCLIHHQSTDHRPDHVHNSQNPQYLTNALNGQAIQLSSSQISQLIQANQSAALSHQRNSIANIPLNLVRTPSKTPSKESIYQHSDFNGPSLASMGKCESIAHSLMLSQQPNQTHKRPSFAQISPHAISNSSTSNNLATHIQRDRLFSVGPSFHIQFKHPSQFGWQQRSNLEKSLIITLAVVFVLFLVLITGSHLYRSYLAQKNQVCMSVECVKTASALLSAMDLAADPCNDFYRYACGNWNKNHIISDDRSSISTFEVMADNLQVILKGLLEEPVSSNSDNSATIKAKTFYKSCMKIEKIEEIHDTPLKELISNLGGWPVINENWQPVNWKKEELLARLRTELNQGTILEMWIGADDKNSTAHIIQIDQMALGLPSREYYLKPTSKKERDAYLKLMIELAVLLGGKREYASKEMKKVLDFEIKLANVSMPEAERQDTGSIYKRLSVKELQNIVKEFDWSFYFNKIFSVLPLKIELDEPVVVYSLNYLLEVGKILEQTDVKIIHNYIIWRLVRNLTPYLAGDYVQKRIDFRKVLLGVSAERVRWTQCVEMVNKRLGMAVGALFIKSQFDPNAKKTALEMIQNIREAFNEILDENDWMDFHTKQVAKKKADSMNERIGYPNFLLNAMELSNEFTQLQVYEDQFLLNILNLLKFEATKNLQKLRKPVDKDKWTTEPAVVNAFYNPNKNDIVFPAGILQPFFYSKEFPKSLNYGAIGVVIGHEITHGFDNKGRQFDKDGNMHQWWENVTINEFTKRAQCIIDQYSSFVLEDVGLNINGKMTNGENIADNGGLKASYRAFKKFETKSGLEPLLPGLNMTHDQLFFLNYAQIWCGTMRPQQQLTSIRSSVHSPGPIRVLGPLSNSADFSRVFNCRLGSRMNPVKKCQIW